MIDRINSVNVILKSKDVQLDLPTAWHVKRTNLYYANVRLPL